MAEGMGINGWCTGARHAAERWHEGGGGRMLAVEEEESRENEGAHVTWDAWGGTRDVCWVSGACGGCWGEKMRRWGLGAELRANMRVPSVQSEGGDDNGDGMSEANGVAGMW